MWPPAARPTAPRPPEQGLSLSAAHWNQVARYYRDWCLSFTFQILLPLLGEEMRRWGVGGRAIPVAMKRCVASRSCGEIFTLISESESLNREKSCRFLSRCGTLCFFRLSAAGTQGTDGSRLRISFPTVSWDR